MTDREPDVVVSVWFVEYGYEFALERDGEIVYEGARDFANSYTLERLWQDFQQHVYRMFEAFRKGK